MQALREWRQGERWRLPGANGEHLDLIASFRLRRDGAAAGPDCVVKVGGEIDMLHAGIIAQSRLEQPSPSAPMRRQLQAVPLALTPYTGIGSLPY